jgi:hypothetical protein
MVINEVGILVKKAGLDLVAPSTEVRFLELGLHLVVVFLFLIIKVVGSHNFATASTFANELANEFWLIFVYHITVVFDLHHFHRMPIRKLTIDNWCFRR